MVWTLSHPHHRHTQIHIHKQLDFSRAIVSIHDKCSVLNFLFYFLGSLILEMGALSRLTGDPRFETAALHALRKLWSMRSSLNLLGTALDVETGEWIEYSSGIGAGTLCC